MAASGGATEWEQVLVRHVVAAKRGDPDRLGNILRIPFPWDDGLGGLTGEGGDLSLLRVPLGRYLVAVLLADDSWARLFSNAADGEALFRAHAASRRLEVAWIGRRPGAGGHFGRVHRAGEPVAEFERPNGTDPPASAEAKAAFHWFCVAHGIHSPERRIGPSREGFELLGDELTPVKTALRGYVTWYG